MKDITTKRPDYRLLKQSDVLSFFHMQMPRWLFCDPKYIHLSLETKVAYTFLLNRFQLSRMNGWVNGEGEVFIIFPREKLAEEIGISYRKAIACFKELLSANLIWEHRVGRGGANRIYMAAVELSEESAVRHSSAPFDNTPSAEPDTRSAEPAGLPTQEVIPKAAVTDEPEYIAPGQDIPNPQVKKCESSMSGCAKTAGPDMRFRHTNKKELKKTDKSDTEKVSQSVRAQASGPPGTAYGRDGQSEMDDALHLAEILEGCELEVLPEEEAGVFQNAITRLFYSDYFRVGTATLPQSVIRAHLQRLEGGILLDTRGKLRKNLDKDIKNSTAYVMTTLLNNIWESKSDLMVDAYLNLLNRPKQAE